MTRGAIARLRAEVRSDRQAARAWLTEAMSVDLGGPGVDRARLSQVAMALHHGYGSVESAMLRVARALEDSAPEGPDWHQALLAEMALEVEGVRPAILGADTLVELRRLLGFRHFFRHAYAVQLDPEQLVEMQRHAARAVPLVERDFDALDELLGSLLAPDAG